MKCGSYAITFNLLTLLLAKPALTQTGCPTPSFAPATLYQTDLDSYSVEVEDINSDGKPDIVIANIKSTTVSILLSDGKGDLAPARILMWEPSFSPSQLLTLTKKTSKI